MSPLNPQHLSSDIFLDMQSGNCHTLGLGKQVHFCITTGNNYSTRTHKKKGAPMTIRHSGGLIAILAIIISTSACSPRSPVSPVVTVTGGTIEGVAEDGIIAFKGIPFAAPPVGDLRWRSPQPVIPWKGVKEVNKFAPGPMQDTAFGAILGGPREISEDCLYLNVWTGAKTIDEKHPVMV